MNKNNSFIVVQFSYSILYAPLPQSEFFHGPKAIFQRVFSGSPPGSPSPEHEEEGTSMAGQEWQTPMAGQEWQTAQGEAGNSSTGSSPQSPLPQIPELEDITS